MTKTFLHFAFGPWWAITLQNGKFGEIARFMAVKELVEGLKRVKRQMVA